MAVAFDAFTKGAEFGSTGTQNTTHTPVGTPKGVLVLISQAGSGADQVSGVTYAGTAMTEITGSPALSSGVTGAVYAYFLGTGIATGAQTVAMTTTGTAGKVMVSISFTAAADTQTDAPVAESNQSGANPTITIVPTVAGVTCYGNSHGVATPGASGTQQAGSTFVTNHDFGTNSAHWSRKDVTAGSTTMGWTLGADNHCEFVVNIAEVAATLSLLPTPFIQVSPLYRM